MKRNLKESLSVVLVMLMIFTSWVFVPPTQAAAEYETTGLDTSANIAENKAWAQKGYTRFKFHMACWDDAEGGVSAWRNRTLTATYIDASGTTKTITLEQIDSGKSNANYVMNVLQTAKTGKTGEYEVPGLLQQIDFTYKFYGDDDGVETDTSLYVADANGVYQQTGEMLTDKLYTSPGSGCDSAGEKEVKEYIKADLVKDLKTATATTVSYGEIGDSVVVPRVGESGKTFTFDAYAHNSAGIARANLTSSLSPTVAGVTFTLGENETDAVFNNIGNFAVNSDALESCFKGGVASKEVTLSATSGSITKTQKVMLYSPTYNFNFKPNNPNGQIVTSIGGDGSAYTGSTITTTYDKAIAYFPTIQSAGYTLLGFTNDASIKDNFINDAMNVQVSGLLSKDDIKGGKLVSVENTDIYAVWRANDVTVKLVDNLNQTLETITAKYGSSLNQLNLSFDEEEVESYESFGKTYQYNGTWFDLTNYQDVESVNNHILTGDVTLQAKYDVTDSDTTYNYIFTAPDSVGGYNTSGTVEYGTEVTAPTADEMGDKTPAKTSTTQYEYIFQGWKKQQTTETELVTEYDYDCQDTFKVFADVTYIPVFKRVVREYNVTLSYKDENGDPTTTTYGVKVPYGTNLDTVEFPTPTPASYSAHPFVYKFAGWVTTEGGAYKPETNTLGKCYGETTIYAAYDLGVAEYELTYVNENGDVIFSKTYSATEVVDASEIIIPEDAYAKTYYKGGFKYTFTGWEDITLENGKLLGDTQIKGKYDEQAVYEITYMGAKGEILDVINYESLGSVFTHPIAPTYEDDMHDTYTFLNWTDEEGNVIADGATITESAVLTAQYKVTEREYQVTFDSDNGEAADVQTYHYGDTITVPADPTKPDTEKYSYTFTGWDKEVSATCVGNETYTALYDDSYVYYKITWLKAEDSAETYSEITTIYGQTVFPPATSVIDFPKAPTDQTAVLNGWYTADGEQYVPGEKTTASKTYYPKFDFVNNPVSVTIQVVDPSADNGGYSYDVLVPYGENSSAIVPMYDLEAEPDETNHYTFDAWKNATGDAIPDTITAPLTIVGTLTAVAHDWDNAKVVDTTNQATFEKAGEVVKACECGYRKTFTTEVLTVDNIAPTGTIQANGVLNGTDTMDKAVKVGPNTNLTFDFKDTAEKDANGVTNVNPSALGSGFSNVKVVVATDLTNVEFDADDLIDTRDTKIYGTMSMDSIMEASGLNLATGDTAYVVAKAADYKGNETTVVFKVEYDETAPEVEIITKHEQNEASQALNVYCEQADLMITGAEKVTVNGVQVNRDSCAVKRNGDFVIIATDNVGNVTQKTIRVVDHSIKHYKDTGTTCVFEGVEYDYCEYCDYESEHTSFTETNHKFKTFITPATCTTAGQEVVKCTVCDEVESEKVIPALGHLNKEIERVEPTCQKDGYVKYSCSRCGVETTEVLKLADGETGHNMYCAQIIEPTCDEQGSKIYKCSNPGCNYETTEYYGTVSGHNYVITSSIPGNCTEKGTITYTCTKCNDSYTEESDIIPTAHNYEFVETVAAAVGQDGYDVYKCSYCGTTEHRNVTPMLIQVNFLDADGNAFDTQTKSAGETIKFQLVDGPEKAGTTDLRYEFKGWTLKDSTDLLDTYTLNGEAADNGIMTVVPVYNEITTQYTVTIYNVDGEVVSSNKYPAGYVFDASKLPAQAEKYKDENGDQFLFVGWTGVPTTIDANANIRPNYKADDSIYTVRFFDINGNEITSTAVKAGETAVYNGDAPTPETAYDNAGHFVFAGWNATLTKVYENMTVKPVFERQDHVFTATQVGATCQSGSGTKYTCSCGHTYFVADGVESAISHNFVLVDTIEATPTADGYQLYRCSMCGKEKKVPLYYETSITFTVNAKYSDHTPAAGILVSVYDGDTLVGSKTTDSEGKATFTVNGTGKYRVVYEGGTINGKVEGEITVDEAGNITSSTVPSFDKYECDCPCHQNGFWGSLFRFFHKIIKALTGDFKCCACPDSRY